MSTTKCTIEFINNPQKIYFAGQTINGRVLLKFENEELIKDIYVQIEGKAHCEWSTGSGKSYKLFTGDELYFSKRNYFYANQSGKLKNFEPGLYVYTFNCDLPNANVVALPTPFEAKIGYCRYSVRINLNRPIWSPESFEETFLILKPYDLTLNSTNTILSPSQMPLDLKQLNHFNSLCCFCICLPANEVLIEGHLPMSGYIPGQTINYKLKITNDSTENINGLLIRIIKIIQYFTSRDSNVTIKEEIIIGERLIGGCDRGQTENIQSHILVPPTIPTDTTSSDICKITYIFRVVADTQLFCQNDPSLDIPITIGTYTSTMNKINAGACSSKQPEKFYHYNRNYGSIYRQQPIRINKLVGSSTISSTSSYSQQSLLGTRSITDQMEIQSKSNIN